MRSIRLLLIGALLLLLALPAAAPARPHHGHGHGHHAQPLVIGHRGASGYRPEHTLASYTLAAQMGADYIEPDLVSTKDGVLVARHEPNITDTTNVADHPEFADRKTTKTIDGITATGWYTEDFTLRELKTLRAKERLPDVRPQNTKYDGKFEVPTFQEVLDLRARLSRKLHRPLGVYPETKHPSYFRSIGLPIEPGLVRALDRYGLNRRGAPVFVQSFEQDNLRALDPWLKVPLVQLLDAKTLRPAANPAKPTYGELATPGGPARASPATPTASGRRRTTSSRATPPAGRCRPRASCATRTRRASRSTRTRSGARTSSCRSSCDRGPTPTGSAT